VDELVFCTTITCTTAITVVGIKAVIIPSLFARELAFQMLRCPTCLEKQTLSGCDIQYLLS
jgi:hypothetical protein